MLDYVSQFRERLSRACELAGQQLKMSQVVMKARADKKADLAPLSTVTKF